MWRAFQKQEAEEQRASVQLFLIFECSRPFSPHILSHVYLFSQHAIGNARFLTSRFGVMNVLHMLTGLVIRVVTINPIWPFVFHLLLAQGQVCVDTESGHVQGSARGYEVVCQSLCAWMCRRSPSCYTTAQLCCLFHLVMHAGATQQCHPRGD